MILAKISSGFCSGPFVRNFTRKTKTKQSISIFMFQIWLFEYILATRCCFVHCLFPIQPNKSFFNHQNHQPTIFALQGKCYVTPVCLYDNSYRLQYIKHRHSGSTQILTVLNCMNEDNENYRKYIKSKSSNGNANSNANLTKLAKGISDTSVSSSVAHFVERKASRDVQKDENMRQYKNILDLIELFLYLLIAICVELIPLAWKNFQRHLQHSSPTLQDMTERQSERSQNQSTSHVEGCFSQKLGKLNWLLAGMNVCKTRTPKAICEEGRTKETEKALLAIGLQLQQQRERNFALVVLKITNSSSRLITNSSNSDIGKELTVMQQFKIRSAIQERYNIKAEDARHVPNSSCYNKQICCCCSSSCCSICCVCCCFCCNPCDSCGICYCVWPCFICGYTCYCCTSILPCNKSYFCYCGCMPSKSFTYAQKLREREHTRGRNNFMRTIKNLCHHVCECLLDWILKICCSQNKIFHQKQQHKQQQKRRLHQQQCHSEHMVKKKSILCNVQRQHHALDNCTSNYQQLKANIVCKFFCNNRKRQKRRRRKRRRRLSALDFQSSNRINIAVVSCSPAIDRSQPDNCKHYEHQRSSMRSLFGSLLCQCFRNFKNAFKTIKNFHRKLENCEIDKIPQESFKQRTTRILEDCNDSQFLIKIVKQTHSIQNQQGQTALKRVYCRGLRGRPNLVWIFIGLVWFESSRLVDCYLHRQKFFENSASPLALTHTSASALSSASTSTKTSSEELQSFTRIEHSDFKNCLSTERYAKQRKKLQWAGQLFHRRSNGGDSAFRGDRRMYETTQGNLKLKGLYLTENSLPNDEVRLESIKSQILSNLGLTGRPNVSHPLPKEFIWDTLYRVDELGTILKSFDFAEIDLEGSTSTWSLMDNYGREHTVQVRVQSNSTHAHQSYKYSEQKQLQQQKLKQPNSVSPHQLIFQNTRDNLKNSSPRNRKNNHNNIKTKLTYLSGITSGMEAPKYLDSDSRLLRGSPRQETETESETNTIGLVVSNVYHPQQQQEDGYLNDRDAEGNLGRTEEIIAFAEEGQLYSQHRILEFSTKTEELIQGKLFVRKAEIHLRIDTNKSNRVNLGEGSSKLKIWIFRVLETNDTKRVSEQQIRFCAAFNIDTRFLGWKKLDITETIQHWLITRRTERTILSDKLRLLIDCTGCGDNYRLNLFEAVNQKQNNIPRDVVGDVHRGNRQKGDAVALWLRQQQQQYQNPKQHLTNSSSFISDPYPVQYHNIHKPFLVIRAEVSRSRRVRRRTMDCSGALHGQCCKESFYVSFKALGWDDWIIAPRGYFANYCRGDCTGPFRTPDTFQTFHAHFIEEYRKMGLLNGMKPCCAPIKFSSMSLIYYGDNGIIKRDLPKMVVDECGCP